MGGRDPSRPAPGRGPRKAPKLTQWKQSEPLLLLAARSVGTALGLASKFPIYNWEIPSGLRGGSTVSRQRVPPSSFRPDSVTVSPRSSASNARIGSGPRGGGAPSSAKAASSSRRLSSRGRSNGSITSASPSRLIREPISGASAQSSASSASRSADALAASLAGSAQSASCQQVADAAPIMPRIAVAGIVDRIESGFARPGRTSSDFRHPSSGRTSITCSDSGRLRPGRRQGRRRPRREQAHQQGFGLVVGMVSGRDRRQAPVDRPFVEQPIAHGPSLGLDIGGRRLRSNRPARCDAGRQADRTSRRPWPPRRRFRHEGHGRPSRPRPCPAGLPPRAAAAPGCRARRRRRLPIGMSAGTSASRSAAKRSMASAAGFIGLAALRLGLGARQRSLQRRPHAAGIDLLQLLIGLAGLARLAELHSAWPR